MGDWKDDVRLQAEVRQHKGGQHVGTPVGVWATHVPTGLRAFCNSERSQFKNRKVAVAMLEMGLVEMGVL